MTARVALDAMAIQRRGRGVSRLLRQLIPLLIRPAIGLDAFVLTTAEGAQLLGGLDGEVVTVPPMPKSIWEQTALPTLAKHHGADRLYTCSECGPLWGPATLLHIPEDPYIRWSTAAANTTHERVRRLYQRAVMGKSVARATRLIVNSIAISDQLRERFAPTVNIDVVPLGVDTTLFYPDSAGITDTSIFHLGSDEPRDQTALVIEAYASALSHQSDLPDLLIAGDLIELRPLLLQRISTLRLDGRVTLLGRVADDELRRLYSQCSICVQPAKYEGFGLQPLEALACGAPLAIFADPAVLDVVGTAAAVANEHDARALGSLISDLWAHPAQRAHYRSLGPRRASQFTWANTASLVAGHLKEMTTQPRPRALDTP